MQVTLTPVLGDADLYVAINSTGPATKTNADFRSTSIDGAEVITISANDTRVTSKCALGQACPIHIGVNGFSNATYVGCAVCPCTIFDGVVWCGVMWWAWSISLTGTQLSLAWLVVVLFLAAVVTLH
jgi:hypothetical protein